MYCSNCGADASGNFCCICGRPIMSPVKAFRKEERRREKAFIQARNDRVYSGYIAEACWCAAVAKLSAPDFCVDQFGQLRPDAYLILAREAELAAKLYAKMEAELESGDYE